VQTFVFVTVNYEGVSVIISFKVHYKPQRDSAWN